MRKGATILAVLLFPASVCGAAVMAQSFGDGVAAYSLQDYQKALAVWRPLANGGDGEAQFRIGLLYLDGRGVEADGGEAARWFQLAGGNGHARASYMLADMYAAGKGVEEDRYQAFEWYFISAEQGDPRAQLQTGILYLDGEITNSDWVQAHVWFTRAAAGLPPGDSRKLAEIARDRSFEALTEEEREEVSALLASIDSVPGPATR
jgi:hypothetical protein